MSKKSLWFMILSTSALTLVGCATRTGTDSQSGGDTLPVLAPAGESSGPAIQQPAIPPPTVVIANVFQSAGGCQSTSQRHSIQIPRADRLDLGFRGIVGGLEIIAHYQG